MTLLLAHPADEDLGRFVEGTLDENERKAVVAHIADCDECRIIVVDSAEFVEPEAAHSGRRWWSAVAAALVTLVGTTSWYVTRNPLTPLANAVAHADSRPTDARLNDFSYVERKSLRGGGESKSELSLLHVENEARRLLARPGNDLKTLHAKGVAHLVLSATLQPEGPEDKQTIEEITRERKEAVETLKLAETRAPNNPEFQSDLAAAYMAIGDGPNLQRALTCVDKALQIDRRFGPALFNRAKALSLLGQTPEAITAYKAYLAVDSSPGWADEARRYIADYQ